MEFSQVTNSEAYTALSLPARGMLFDFLQMWESETCGGTYQNRKVRFSWAQATVAADRETFGKYRAELIAKGFLEERGRGFFALSARHRLYVMPEAEKQRHQRIADTKQRTMKTFAERMRNAV